MLLILAFFPWGTRSASPQEEYRTYGEYVPNEVIVKFKPGLDKYLIQDGVISVQGKIVSYLGKEIEAAQWQAEDPLLRSFIGDPDLFLLRVPDSIGIERAITDLNRNPNILFVCKNAIFHALVEPNEPNFYRLWGLKNTGLWGGVVDADIDAPEAWDLSTGNLNIVVAIIDTGIDYNHADLAPNMWTNTDEIPGNGSDDDHNGFVDDVRGWDFVNNDNDPIDDNDQPPYQPVYHGTHIAGVIGAKGNNGLGVAGVNWNVKLMPAKARDRNGQFFFNNFINAIDYATQNGAHLTNNSYGSYETSPQIILLIENAVVRARTAGRLFVAAAGNDSLNIDAPGHKFYPAGLMEENVIAVASTNNRDELSSFSNWGPLSVDLGAPGGTSLPFSEDDIYSTKRYNAYQYLAGTSMAAPYVAGVAALAWGYRPDAEDYASVKYAIMNSVDPKPSLAGMTLTGGRLNAGKALYLPVAPSNLGTVGYCFEVKLTWRDNSSYEDGFIIYRQSGSNYYEIGRVGPNVTAFWDTDLPCGLLWCYEVRAYNWAGISPFSPSKCAHTLSCAGCGGGLSLEMSPDKVAINSGELVTYTYRLANKGDEDLTDVYLTDDKLGEVAAKLSLKKRESKEFSRTVAISETATNFAEASAICKNMMVKAHACATIWIKR